MPQSPLCDDVNAVDRWTPTTSRPRSRQCGWQAAHTRLEGAKEDYLRRTAGRASGRPINDTESKYLLTGLAQCGWCNGGMAVQSRSHGARRGYFYACTSYHLRGGKICENRQYVPMEATNAKVLETFGRSC